MGQVRHLALIFVSEVKEAVPGKHGIESSAKR
jgi:hypothetical protein